MIEEVGIRLRTDGAVEASNGTALAGAAVEKLGRQAQAATPQLDRLGVSVGQTRNAMRQLPAQITDVVTSLASGQQAWLVAIQQGGQIKDSFGGAVPAFNALRAAISPTALAVGGLGAGVAVLTLAYEKGAREQQNYLRGILLTGNYASTTTGQLDAMARRVDAVAGTQAQAAEVLAQLVSTGNVTRAQLEQGTQAAIQLQRSLGVEVETTVKAMSALGKEPLAASIKLNEQYRFLTISTYAQIRALEQQGRTAEAAAVAQDAFAKVGIERAKEMEANLGTLQKGWRGLTDVAREAWDAMLGLGRQETVEKQLAAVQAALAAPVRRGGNTLQAEQRREAMRQQEAELQEMLRIQQRAGDRQAAQAAAVQAKIDKDKIKAVKGPGYPTQVGPLTFEEMFPAANVRDITGQRDSVRSARVAELQDYDNVDKAMRRDRMAADKLERDQRIENDRAIEKIFLDMYALRPEKMKPVWQQMLEGWKDTNQQMQETWDNTMGATLQAGEAAWVQWAQTGKFNIRSVAQAWLAEQARGAFRNLLGSIFGAATGGNGGFNGQARAGDLFHSGGIAGGTPTSRRVVAASTWHGAPRMHGGGIASDEVPAILKKKEGVFTEEQMRALAPVDSVKGGRSIVFSPQINIDSRTDRAEVAALVQGAMRSAQAELVERMDRGEM